MIVTILQTVKGGAKEVGTITLNDDGNIEARGLGAEVADSLLYDVDIKDGNAVRKALEDAPRVYGGTYLRARID